MSVIEQQASTPNTRSGATAAVAIAAAFLFGEHLNLTAIAGMALVVIGVVLMAFSGATTHA